MASTLSVQLPAAPGARVAVRAGAVRRVPAVRSLTVASASRTTEAAKAAVTGALLAVIAAAPLVDVGAAYAVRARKRGMQAPHNARLQLHPALAAHAPAAACDASPPHWLTSPCVAQTLAPRRAVLGPP